MDKGQIESIGLVMVVVLIVLLMVIALPFILKEGEEKDDGLLSLKADSLRNSVLGYSRCEGVSVKEEIINCEFDSPECPRTCEELGKEIEEMINSVLEPNIIYEFNVESSNPVKIGDSEGCLNKFSSAPQPLSRSVRVKVDLCRK